MRKAIFAAAALCPMLIQAQVISPAQPMNSMFMARLTTPVTSGAFKTASSGAVPETPASVSTGVTAPKLLQPEPVTEKANWHWQATETDRLAVVSVVINPNGTPSQVHVIRSLGAEMDNDVVASVSHYHFQPASLNHEAIPIHMELTIKIQNRLQ